MTPRTKEQSAAIREERRHQILDSAYKVFSSKGYHQTKISDVATEAGVSYGTIYHYYDSKEDLFMAIFEKWVSSYTYQAALEDDIDTYTASMQLRAIAHAAAGMMIDSTEFLPVQMEFWGQMLRSGAIRERFRLLFAELRTFLSQTIQVGIDNKEFRQVDAEPLAAAAMAVYDGLILQWLADPNSVDWQKASQAFIETLLVGLLAE